MKRMTKAQQRLAADNMGLVRFVAGKIGVATDEELVSEGYAALCRAAMAYKPELAKFATYACHAIFRAIGGARRKRLRSRTAYVEDIEGTMIAAGLHDDCCPQLPAEHRELVDSANAVMWHMPARVRGVIHRRFGLETGRKETLREIGADLGISRERVRQIERAGLRELAEAMGG